MIVYDIGLQAYQNADWIDNFQLLNEDGSVYNITGAAFKMDIRDVSGSLILALTTANGRLPLITAASGIFGIDVPAATMAGIAAGLYRHDLLMTLSGDVTRLWEGRLLVETGVTQ